jgi:ATP-dependent RNA helicase DDX10/DBP4
LEEERVRMREAHRIDKEVAREKKREKKRKRQERGRGDEDEEGSDDGGLAVIGDADGDGGDDDDFINGLVGMLDRAPEESDEEEQVRPKGKKSKRAEPVELEDEEALALRLLQGD